MNTPLIIMASERPPRQPAFNAAVFIWMGFVAVFFFIGLATFQQQFYSASLLGLGWYPLYGLINGSVAFVALLMVWLRQKWAFYLLSAQIAMGSMLVLTLPMSKEQALFGPAFLAVLVWAMHVGGRAGMWQQMFGSSLLPGLGFGQRLAPIRPAMPPTAAPQPPATPPRTAAPPPPAPISDPFDQLRQLAALRDGGAITVDEFDRKKTEILKRL